MSPSGTSFSSSQAKVQCNNSNGLAQGVRTDLPRGSHLCLANWHRMRGGTEPITSWTLTPHTWSHATTHHWPPRAVTTTSYMEGIRNSSKSAVAQQQQHDGMQNGRNAYRWKVVRYIPWIFICTKPCWNVFVTVTPERNPVEKSNLRFCIYIYNTNYAHSGPNMQVGCGVDCSGAAKPAGRWECALFMSMKYAAMTVIAHARTPASWVLWLYFVFSSLLCIQLPIPITQIATEPCIQQKQSGSCLHMSTSAFGNCNISLVPMKATKTHFWRTCKNYSEP